MDNVLPEYESVEAFAELLYDEERSSYSYEEITMLSSCVRVSVHRLIKELEGYGLTYRGRPKKDSVRGFKSNDHNRWDGNPCSGGSGYEQIAGFAGRKG